MFNQHPLALLGWPENNQTHLRLRKSVGEPLPRTMAEVASVYGSLLREILDESGLNAKSVTSLAQELGARGVLKDFDFKEHLPGLLDCNAVWDLLACTYGQWCGFINRACHRDSCPKHTPGSPTSTKVQFDTRDILALYGTVPFFNRHESLFPGQTVRAFEDYLRASAERVVHDWKMKMSEKSTEITPDRAKTPEAGVTFVGWPIGVPKNYDHLYREYRVFVERTLNRYIKPCPSQQIEDVKQHIWMKLVESKTIEKFVEKARRRKIPAQLSATEAVEYLGITWDQWMDLMRRDEKWLQPEGSVFSATAIFTAKQIRNVEESGQFPILDAIPASDMSKVFRGYLSNVVHNHFANYCRTRVRRFIKDIVVPNENSRVNGGKLGSALEGDMTSWEDALVDPGSVGHDLCFDLPEVEDEKELQQDLTEQIERIHKTCPGRQDDVFDLIAEGLTLREAINKVRALVHEEKLKVQVG